MISIDDHELSEHLLITERKAISKMSDSVANTIGGVPVVTLREIVAGQELELSCPNDTPPMKGDVVDMFCELRDSGKEVVFHHHQGSWRVLVTDVSMDTVYRLANPDDNDNYTGTITLFITEWL